MISLPVKQSSPTLFMFLFSGKCPSYSDALRFQSPKNSLAAGKCDKKNISFLRRDSEVADQHARTNIKISSFNEKNR